MDKRTISGNKLKTKIMDTYRGPHPLYKRMSIANAKDLKEAIDLAIAGNKYMIYDIADYVTYNYYGCMHINEGSADDKENEKLYTAFKENHPHLYEQVAGWINFKLNRLENLYKADFNS
jgi:hypothetical protein